MRIQSTHDSNERGLDAYFTCREAIETLILVEGDRLPKTIWEPAAGDGAIVLPLRATGRIVHASDIADYGLPGCHIMDTCPPRPRRLAGPMASLPIRPTAQPQEFAVKAISEVPYIALLVRTNFLMDGEERGHWLDRNPPTRTWYLLPRIPMMHRVGTVPGRRATHRIAGSSGRPEGRLPCRSPPTGGIYSVSKSRPRARRKGA
jgi:hypothetical protein